MNPRVVCKGSYGWIQYLGFCFVLSRGFMVYAMG